MMNEHLKFNKAFVFLLILVLLFTFVIPWAMTGQAGEAKVTFSIAFKGAGNGLDPQGNRFDINELKSEKVLKAAIIASKLEEKVTTAELRKKIYILPQAHQDTLRELLTLTTIEGKTQDIKERMVYPTTFTISLKDNGLPSYFQEKKLLKNILKEYQKYLESSYLADVNSEPAYSKEEILAMDYPEMMAVLEQQADSTLRYIGIFSKNEPQYMSEKEGTSFNDLYERANILKNTNISNMKSLVNYYGLTREDSASRIRYEESLLKRVGVTANKQKGAELAASSILQIYKNDSNYIFMSQDVDTANLKPAENQYYSNLTKNLVERQDAYLDTKYKQEDVLRTIERLKINDAASAEYQKAAKEIQTETEETLLKLDTLKEQGKNLGKEFYAEKIKNKITTGRVTYEINTFGNFIVNVLLTCFLFLLLKIAYFKIKTRSYSEYYEIFEQYWKAITKLN